MELFKGELGCLHPELGVGGFTIFYVHVDGCRLVSSQSLSLIAAASGPICSLGTPRSLQEGSLSTADLSASPRTVSPPDSVLCKQLCQSHFYSFPHLLVLVSHLSPPQPTPPIFSVPCPSPSGKRKTLGKRDTCLQSPCSPVQIVVRPEAGAVHSDFWPWAQSR